LKARGTYYDDLTKVTRKAEDSTSQDDYQKRTLAVNGKYLDDTTVAQSYADYALSKFKEPRGELSISVINQDSATLADILNLEISDRISIANDELGIASIDMGNEAINRSGFVYPTITFIDNANPANYTGTLTSIQVWATTNLTGLRVGTFYNVSGTTYKCRDSETIGSVTAGSLQTFTVDIDVVAGDYIGCYFASGWLEASDTLTSTLYYKVGEYIDPNDSATFSTTGNNGISLYATGQGYQNFFIDYMQHNISTGGTLHTVKYQLADCINEDFWCLGFSALASTSIQGQTKLGY